MALSRAIAALAAASALAAAHAGAPAGAATTGTSLPGGLRFPLTRRHVEVPTNSTLHHRYGVVDRPVALPSRQRAGGAGGALDAARETGNDGLSSSSPSSSSSSSPSSSSSSSRAVQDEVPVYGDFRRLAYFFADVFIGSQPQKFTVITDTGSSLTAVPCNDCGDCGPHMNPRFDPAASSSAHILGCSECSGSAHCTGGKCQYVQSYAEGSSLRGILYRDTVYVGGDTSGGPAAAFAIPFTFGCGVHEGGLFTTQEADGIMGLGQSEMSVIRALWGSGKLEKNVFSLCLSLQGGAFALGQVDPRIHTGGAIAWARMSLTGFYVVQVAGMGLEGSPLTAEGFNSPHTILDSGTTFTYIPSAPYSALRSAIASYCAADRAARCKGSVASVSGEPLCYRLTDPAHISTFPSMSFTLTGSGDGGSVVVVVPPQHLFINMGWDQGAYCLSVYDNGHGGGVLGANVMMGHDVIFDMEGAGAGPRAGFATSTCVLPPPGELLPTPTASPTPTPSQTPSPSPTSTSSNTPTASATPSTTPSVGAPPSATSSPTPTPSTSPSHSAGAAASGNGNVDDKTGAGDNAGVGGPAPGPSTGALIAGSVVASAMGACLVAYFCMTCECRVGRVVIRLEGGGARGAAAGAGAGFKARLPRTARYEEVDEDGGEGEGEEEDGEDVELEISPRAMPSPRGRASAGLGSAKKSPGRTTAVAVAGAAGGASTAQAAKPSSAQAARAAAADEGREAEAAAMGKLASALAAGPEAPAAKGPDVAVAVRDDGTKSGGGGK
jgi:hypothetical protein